jgi:hypothetical protein
MTELTGKNNATPKIGYATEGPSPVWLNPGSPVWVLWTEPTDRDTGLQTEGIFKGIRVDEGGGPSYLVVKTDEGDIAIHTEDVSGAEVKG